MNFSCGLNKRGDLPKTHGWGLAGGWLGACSWRALGTMTENASKAPMTPKPAFPAPDHDHHRCAADAITHAERVCKERAQKFTPIRRQVLQALLSSHRPLGAYEVIDELAKSMPRPAPITVYRALDFLMANSLVHRIESRNAYLACAHDHDATS